jgi:GMP synthase (glutamine-hydrolysing)
MEESFPVNVLVIQHSAKDRPGIIAEMIRGCAVHRADLVAELPSLDGFDALVVLGGPQAAYSDTDFPSRRSELATIREALRRDIPVLGICLGGQLLAIAAGGRGYRRETPEIGWLPVTLSAAGRQDPLFQGCTPTFTPRQKHFDSFEMPPGAVRLASSEACEEQGFRLGRHTWGVQFHFEMSAPGGPLVDQTAIESAKRVTELAGTSRSIITNFIHAVETSIAVKCSADGRKAASA